MSLRLRSGMIPNETSVNANSVPILTRSVRRSRDIQKVLDQLGGSYRRDEARTSMEKARAREIAKAYIKSQNGRLITDPKILATYED